MGASLLGMAKKQGNIQNSPITAQMCIFME